MESQPAYVLGEDNVTSLKMLFNGRHNCTGHACLHLPLYDELLYDERLEGLFKRRHTFVDAGLFESTRRIASTPEQHAPAR